MRFKMLSLIMVFVVAFVLLSSPASFAQRKIGDINNGGIGDGVIDIGDIVWLLNYLFKNGDPPIPVEAGDVNYSSGVVNIGDVVYLLNYLYKHGPAPLLPIVGDPVTHSIGTQHLTVIPDQRWYLYGPCWVDSAETLTVDPGVHVYGSVGQPTTYLAIQQYGTIIADGTSDQPIVFTSNAPPGSRRGGDWGGLMLFGLSPLNVGCGMAEGNAGEFGCDCPPGGLPPCDEHDNSGVLRYVRVEFAGVELGPDNELNGIAMYGVGDGTIIDYVQVHRNYDDGIEWFGGTVNCKHVLISECWDDHFDWTDGARFQAQFVALRGYGGDFPGVGRWGDRMIEGDNQENDYDLLSRSQPLICNITIVGGKEVRNPGGAPVSNSENIKLRHGTAGRIYNLICMDAVKSGLDCQHTNEHAWTGDPANHWPNAPDGSGIDRTVLDVDYALWYNNDYDSDPARDGIGHWKDRHSAWCPTPTSGVHLDAVCLCDPNLPHVGDVWATAGLYTDACYDPGPDPYIQVSLPDDGSGMYDPMLIAPREVTEVTGNLPDFRPLPGSPALDPGNALDPSTLDPFFDPVQYLGAFDVGDPTNHNNDWTYPWAAWPDN